MGSSVTTRAGIEALIPHREPFLFVDRVLERSAERAVAEWDVPHDLPALRGHYPGAPVLPGVLTLEFAFQAAAILFAREGVSLVAGGAVPALTRIEDARFRRAVRPGETLRALVECVDRAGPARKLHAHVTCGAETVARIAFTVAEVALGP